MLNSVAHIYMLRTKCQFAPSADFAWIHAFVGPCKDHFQPTLSMDCACANHIVHVETNQKGVCNEEGVADGVLYLAWLCAWGAPRLGFLKRLDTECKTLGPQSRYGPLYATIWLHGVGTHHVYKRVGSVIARFEYVRFAQYNPRFVSATLGSLRKARIHGLHKEIRGWCEFTLCV